MEGSHATDLNKRSSTPDLPVEKFNVDTMTEEYVNNLGEFPILFELGFIIIFPPVHFLIFLPSRILEWCKSACGRIFR